MNVHILNAAYLMPCFLALLSFSASANNGAEPIPIEEFDQIVSELNSPNKPAFAVAIFKKDKLIYEKAFGSASLEYKIPATVHTKFQIDTLAWEFIAYAVLKLEEQGKIKLDDDIGKYVPGLPNFGTRITVNHLLSSTDGLHGYKVLRSLSGWEPTGAEQHNAVLQLVKSQKKLNFKPGDGFSPGGDTRLILLAKIVEAASGKAFDEYSKNDIFLPLGMTNTAFLYGDAPPMDNTAMPYRNDGKGAYTIDHGRAKVPGPVNLYSSIRDLAIWRSAIFSDALGGKAPATKLNAPIKLDSGQIIKDIASISTYGQQHAGKERGIAKIYQIGSFGGYASSIFRFPDQDITAVVLSSGLAYNGSYGMRIAAAMLKHHFLEPETIDYGKIESVKLSPAQRQKYEGVYWSSERALAARVHVKNDVLYYTRTEADGRVLIPLSDATFQLKIDGDDPYFIKFVDKKGNMDMHFSMGESDPVVFEKYRAVSYAANELAQFTGTFYSEELNSSFAFEVKNGQLTANNVRVGSVAFKPVKVDVFSGNKSFMGGVQFNRNTRNQIIGFQVVVDEVRNLEFKKVRFPDS